MSGKEMVFDGGGNPISGAGYYEALEGDFIYIPFRLETWFGLYAGGIEWDDTGKTIAIKNLRPKLETEKKIYNIVSDVKKPRLLDGILYLKLEGKGDKEYKFKIIFGEGKSFEPKDLFK